MIRKALVRRAAITGTIAFAALAAGSQYAAAQTEQRQSAAQQGKLVAAPTTTTTTTNIISQPNATGAAPRPLDRIGLPLTEAQCTGLGGVVTSSVSKKCASTGKICFRADQDGVIHSSCITAS